MSRDEHVDEATAANILKAQTYKGITPDNRVVKERNFAELLERGIKEYPDKTYLIYYNDKGARSEYTYGRFNELVNRVADFMTGSLDLKRGDRISTVMFNHPETIAVYFAIWKLGGCVAPCNAGEDDDRIKFTIENSNAKVVFVREEYFERVSPMKKEIQCVEHMVGVGEKDFSDQGFFNFSAEIEKGSPEFTVAEEAELDDEALIIYTSGTTGPPKGVVLNQYNILADCRGMARWHDMTPDRRMMCVLPVHHVNGLIVTHCTPLYVGSSVVLNQRFQTKSFWERIERERVSLASVVPTLLEFLYMENEDISGRDLSEFRHILCGAGPLTVDLATRFEERFKQKIVHGYGLSETTCYSCFIPYDLDDRNHNRWMRDYGYPAIGIAIEPNEMAIHNDNGEEVAEDVRGEIVLRGHNIMKYYYKRPDANLDTFKFGWFRSGDEGFFKYDDKGNKYFFITGRLKELIIRGGINLSPFEIDEALMSIPGVKCGLAVGFDNKFYGEEVGAYVQLEEGSDLTGKDIMAKCREKLSFTKTPKVVIFGDDIPVTSTGKYQRNKLKGLFKQWESEQFREK